MEPDVSIGYLHLKHYDTVQSMEYQLAKQSGKINKFYLKWSKLYPELVDSAEQQCDQQMYINQYIVTLNSETISLCIKHSMAN